MDNKEVKNYKSLASVDGGTLAREIRQLSVADMRHREFSNYKEMMDNELKKSARRLGFSTKLNPEVIEELRRLVNKENEDRIPKNTFAVSEHTEAGTNV